MNTNYAVKYLKEIEKTIATKINLVKEPSELLESKQHYYDEVLKIYQEAFTRLIEYSVTFSKLLNEINKAYRNALHARDERISLFITQDKHPSQKS
ncbi:unnamed protein product [Parnassius apollo]|uniref:(apollo) hypothetical protein n=1 Tax=Parnassius apollo TaxID=110799 RepID=A0A8S3YAP2_PARAO|nr:unnamed protein product [Parnassius apollo]